MKKSLYAIGYEWPDGSLGFYTLLGGEILHSTKKDALETLDYVKRTNSSASKEYKLFKIKLKEVIE